ncbi:hypothetical protein BC829DRAFT_448398 [Chytridium lagenaria]|nr:hypothetical protein BC829DRAFT_448398 [Chytridium lagenaria]
MAARHSELFLYYGQGLNSRGPKGELHIKLRSAGTAFAQWVARMVRKPCSRRSVAGSFDPEWAINANLRGIEERPSFCAGSFLSSVEAFRDAITRYDLKTKIEEEFTLELRHGSILVLGYLLGICTIDPSPRPRSKFGVTCEKHQDAVGGIIIDVEYVPEANVNAMELVDDVVRGREGRRDPEIESCKNLLLMLFGILGSVTCVEKRDCNFMFTLPSLRGNHIKVNFTVGDWAVCATAFGYASSS